MSRIKIISIAVGWVFIIASCSPAATSETDFAPTVINEENGAASQNGIPRTEAEVPRVSLEDTLAAIESGEAVVVDVRGPDAYQASHVAGAISIPLGEIETNPDGLPLDKDQWIITYCT